jgi:hypothetical protein
MAPRNNFTELIVGVDKLGIVKLSRLKSGWSSKLLIPADNKGGDTFFDMETAAQTNSVYIGTSVGVFRLTKDDRLELQLEMRDAMAIEVHPHNAQLIYAGSPFNGVFKTVNSGKNWHDVSRGLPARAIMALKISPSQKDMIYVVSRCSGVWKKDFSKQY